MELYGVGAVLRGTNIGAATICQGTHSTRRAVFHSFRQLGPETRVEAVPFDYHRLIAGARR